MSDPLGVPPGAAWHPPLTPLDQASMRAAMIASFKGIYGREPSGVPGSGADDVAYWVSVSDHYGEFSDHVYRAGWSRYWETKLSGTDTANPALGDVPARWSPQNVPPAPPEAPGAPIPVPPDLAAVLSVLAAQGVQLNHLEALIVALGHELDRPVPSYTGSVFGIPITLHPQK